MDMVGRIGGEGKDFKGLTRVVSHSFVLQECPLQECVCCITGLFPYLGIYISYTHIIPRK